MKKMLNGKNISIGLIVLCLPAIGVSGDGQKHSGHSSDNTKYHQADTAKEMKHDMAHGHGHGKIDVSTFANQPTIALHVMQDAKSGWNIQIKTTHFEFAPGQVNKEHNEGQGHAHLYVDGEKVTRLYGHWYHLEELEPGAHTVRVTLNANNHADLVKDGETIEATFEILQGT